MQRRNQRISVLVQKVLANPVHVLTGSPLFVQQLAAFGAAAVKKVLRAMSGPYPSAHHPIDVIEALGVVLSEVARTDPKPLITALERETAPPDPHLCFVVSALHHARASEVITPLTRALKHRNQYVRWSAARALVKLRRRQAIGPLVEALRDRASDVKFVVVRALKSNKFFRTPAAIKPLQKIVANDKIKRRWPGIWEDARDALGKLTTSGQP